MTTLLLILWFVIGFASFVFWWTKDFDLLASDMIPALVMGLFGPTAFLIMWSVHNGKNHKEAVIFKRRKR